MLSRRTIQLIALGFYMFFSTNYLIGQSNYHKDITIFEGIMEKYHPSLYDYTPKTKLDSIINNTLKSAAKIKNDYDLILALANITEKIGCGHTTISPSSTFMNTIAEKEHFFPMPIKIIDQKIYALDNNFDIEIGKEIREINAVSSKKILVDLYNIIGSDGRNIAGKNKSLDEAFALYFHAIYPNFKTFKLKVEGMDSEIEVKGVNLNTSLELSSNTILKYKQHNNTDPVHFEMIDKDIGLLTVNTFFFPEEDQDRFFSYLEDLFAHINEEKTPNIIIDVRNNQGGLREFAIYLYSFLTDKPFTQRTSTSIGSGSIDSKYLTADKAEVREVNQWLSEKFGSNNKSAEDDLQNLMQPNDIQYKGQIFVIIGNDTFSAGGEFALNCKNNPDIVLVGQETGAAFSFHNGDYPLNFILPDSKIEVTVPSTHMNHYVTGDNQGKTGIYPDYFISENIEDYINQNDLSIKKVRQLISKGQ